MTRLFLALIFMIIGSVEGQKPSNTGYSTKQFIKCHSEKHMIGFSHRYMNDTISCEPFENCPNDTNCVWSASCKESRINKEVSKDRIFANGIAARKNPRYSKVLCCESYMYTFNHCISKVIKFINYFRYKISTKTANDIVITDVKFRRLVRRGRPNKATVKLCHRREIPLATCPIDKNQKQDSKKKDKSPDEKHEKTNPDNNQQKANPNEKQQQIKPKDQPNGQQRRIGPEPKPDQSADIAKEQLTEETGISTLKWMTCTIGCPIAAGVGLKIGVDFTSCIWFEIEGEDVSIDFSSAVNGFVPIGGRATIKCNDPEATLIGSSVLTCKGNSQWDKGFPYCDYACNLLTVVDGDTEYSEQQGENILDGETATVDCSSDDMKISDDDSSNVADSGTTFACDKGDWKEFEPLKCLAVCDLLTVENGDIGYTKQVGDNILSGGTATVNCTDDQKITDDETNIVDSGATFICDKGEWTEFEPQKCFAVCDLLSVEGGTVDEYSKRTGDYILDGSTTAVTCPLGQPVTDDGTNKANSESTFSCVNGEWKDFEPKRCTKLCSKSITSNAHGANPPMDQTVYTQDVNEQVKDGGTGEIKCNGVKVGEFTCNDGQWEESCDTDTGCWSYLASDKTNGYYKQINDYNTFDNAKSKCQDNCAQLVTIHNEKEYNHILSIRQSTKMWIGLIREGGSNADPGLEWIDDTPLGNAYTTPDNWFTWNGPPFSISYPYCTGCVSACTCRNCVYLGSEWNTVPCTNQYPSMCSFYVDGI